MSDPQYRHSSSARRRSSHPDGDAVAPPAVALLLMLAWAGLLCWAVWSRRLPFWALEAALALNLLTFWVYWRDKRAAQHGQWRTPEKTLHLLGLWGGWPAAAWAQALLRHKSRKAEFRLVYWLSVAIHCTALLGWLFWLQPRMLLNL
ncbi:DUF1294 domain-containing protein [Rhodoferax sp.]|uniref:DUF1294 domain-containing protein n=1 Tax=Rhodoferax sp. TaxID=50421 RepID=UPI00374DC1D7